MERSKVILSEIPIPKKSEKVSKPWGYELIWAHTKDYVAKILVVNAGHSLSLQFHKTKEETLFIESGECTIETGPDAQHLTPLPFSHGGVFHVPPGCIHRINAITDCRIFEVSTPHLSDVVRLEDRYGRSS